jgi:hypothetical protein
MGSLTLTDKVLARAAGSLGEKGARLRVELDMLGVAQPAEMTGKSLRVKK